MIHNRFGPFGLSNWMVLDADGRAESQIFAPIV
jgi:hypothetical protein